MKKPLYLVTGACGHLGSQIVKQLVLRGDRVRILQLPGEKDALVQGLGVEVVLGDVRDKESLRPFFQYNENDEAYVIHAAGIVSIAATADDNLRRVNVEGTRNMVDLCKENAVKRLLYVSSVHALPEAKGHDAIHEAQAFDERLVQGAYAKTKAEATQIVLDAGKNGLDVVVIHPSGIIGPGDGGSNHSNQIFRDYLRGRLPAIVKGGYDFVDVRDVAQGIIQALETGKPGNCYILANSHFEIRRLVALLQEYSGSKGRPLVMPLWLVAAFAPLAEALDKLRSQRPCLRAIPCTPLPATTVFRGKRRKGSFIMPPGR